MRATRKYLPRERWEKLRAAFAFGHSLGAISEATGISRGTLSARCVRHGWSRDRSPDVEILRKETKPKNEHE
jgi:hypothetical protein